ncbi:MAG: zinc dependent phospholipase C family protein, partial [Clostridia bacterium]|nr:zinc dependent phospholipase C family protein [Clostridia bacterium]
MKRIVSRLISVLLVTMMCISALPVEVFAWGKMTHVYTANIIEGLTAQGTGSIAILDGGDSAFEYDIPDEYYEAIMAYPDAFRAGSLGPDVYPDIFTGQVYIHPEDDGIEADLEDLEDFKPEPNPENPEVELGPEDLKVDSGMWIAYLCDAVNKLPEGSEDRKMCLSFTLGCILHYCGDLFGHDFVNTFSGGAFPSIFSTEIFDIKGERLNNILSHLSIEGYMDDVVYPSYDADRDGDIDAPNKFVSGAMVFDGSPAIGLNPIY